MVEAHAAVPSDWILGTRAVLTDGLTISTAVFPM